MVTCGEMAGATFLKSFVVKGDTVKKGDVIAEFQINYDQTELDEPPVTAYVTFDRVKDIIDACDAAGVGKAEYCLVGWNYRGHDGRWPQMFPVEPLLGGERHEPA